MIPFLDLSATYRELQANLNTAMEQTLLNGQYILGLAVEQFESVFAEYTDAKHCISVGSGLDALRLTLRAWGVGRGDEVIVPSHTAFPTWSAITETGATPIPWEGRLGDFHADPDTLEVLINSRTKAIVPVHLYGWCVDMPRVREIANRHAIPVLEDAAQSHGALFNGHPPGYWGDAAAWSFYPSKNLGAFGDGGAVTTNNSALAAQLRMLRNYGSATKNVHDSSGLNSRLDAIQAAVLTVKLQYLDQWNAHRRAAARRYLEELQNTSCELPRISVGNEPVWHIFPIKHFHRNKLQQHLLARGIQTLIHYPTPPHLQPAYTHLGYAIGSLPNAEMIAETELSLPIGPHLQDDDITRIIDCIRQFKP